MTTPPVNFAALLEQLLAQKVEFILVGGVAGNLLGAARATYDVDIVYRRTAPNLTRLVEALSPVQPYLRGASPGLPFVFDIATLERGLNFTLTTALGDLDLLGEVAGGGSFDALLAESYEVELFGHRCRSVTLDGLIRLKRAAGRPKDLDALAELEALRDER